MNRKLTWNLVVLLFLLNCSQLVGAGSARQPDCRPGERLCESQDRIAPALLRDVSFLRANPHYDYPMPVIVRLSGEVVAPSDGRTRGNFLPLINSYKARLTARQLDWLLDSERVEYVTVDSAIRTTGKKSGGGSTENPASQSVFLKTIGADQAAALGYTGNTNVALFDSGMASRPDLQAQRILNQIDFTTGNPLILSSNSDDYGHGTHVAGIIGGTGDSSAGQYRGVAPTVEFLDVRVVDATGQGTTSNLIAAIDWVIAHKDEYAIRIANLSLGRPPIDSYLNDPLCQAVERMVEAGIVTVVSAGNLGKTSQEPVLWGAITSPANSPAVITVGAVNTRGTATHSDDIATTYGSRGPTYIDGIFKPDLSAPANGIVSLLSSNSLLHKDYSDLQVDGQHIQLSGTSMAAGYVTGTVALMLEANWRLTPRMVKALLLVSAIKLQQPSMLEQGNGLVNTLTAVQLAKAVNVSRKRLDQAVAPHWDLNGEQVWAGGAFAFDNNMVYSELVSADSADSFWGDGLLWTDGLFWTDGMFWTEGLFSRGSSLWDASLNAESLFWTDGMFWTEGMIWSEGMFWTEGMIWTEGMFWTEGMLWTEGMIRTEDSYWADSNMHDYHGDR